jgi:hypothetical protein
MVRPGWADAACGEANSTANVSRYESLGGWSQKFRDPVAGGRLCDGGLLPQPEFTRAIVFPE